MLSDFIVTLEKRGYRFVQIGAGPLGLCTILGKRIGCGIGSQQIGCYLTKS